MTSRSTHPTPQPSLGPTLGGPGATSILSALASLLGAASFFTQRLAHHLGYHELLGRPWLFLPLPEPVLLAVAAAGLALPIWALAAPQRRPAAPALLLPSALAFALAYGPLYPPAAGFDWFATLLRTSWRWTAVGAAAEAAAVLVAGLVITAALLRRAVARGSSVAATAHGSARFADRADLATADLLSGEGLVLGALGRGRRPPFGLTDRSGQHALVVMPPGAGKTTGPIASSLLNTPEHSALVLDPKGELFELTAGWRADVGQNIVRFSPHTGTRDGQPWNPLAEVGRRREMATLSALAENLVSYPADVQGADHWTAAARSLLRCLLLHELYSDRRPTIAGTSLQLISHDGKDDLDSLFAKMATARHDRHGQYRWLDVNGNETATHPEIARLARTFEMTPERERGSIVSTLNRFLDLWGDPDVAVATDSSGWNLSLLTDPRKPTTVYVTAPFDELVRLAPLLRILVALLVLRLTDDSAPYSDAAAGGRRRVLLVLDEFASLGRIPLLEQVLAFLRGYGVVNEDGSVYLQTLGRGQQRVDGLHLAPAEVENLLATVASLHDTVVTADEPVLEATLPIANARLEALLPPLVSSPVLALRKPPARLLTLANLVGNGTLSADLATVLSRAFRDRRTLVVAGGVGSGKTTLANALLADLLAHHPDERVVILEEGARELHVDAGNVVRLLTSERAGIGMGRLVRTALRLNPSRLLIGEARGPEALDFLRAANTGHPGSLLTTHANGARQALDRLDALAQEAGVPSQLARIAEAVDLVVFVARTAGGRRRVLEVVEVGGPDAAGRPVPRTVFPVPTATGSTPTP